MKKRKKEIIDLFISWAKLLSSGSDFSLDLAFPHVPNSFLSYRSSDSTLKSVSLCPGLGRPMTLTWISLSSPKQASDLHLNLAWDSTSARMIYL